MSVKCASFVRHIAPMSVECASFGKSFGEFGRSPVSGDLHEFHEFGRSPLSGDLHVAQRARRARLCSFVAKPNFPYSPNGHSEVGVEEGCHSSLVARGVLFEESSLTLQASGLVGETKNIPILWPAGAHRCEQESSSPMVAIRARERASRIGHRCSLFAATCAAYHRPFWFRDSNFVCALFPE